MRRLNWALSRSPSSFLSSSSDLARSSLAFICSPQHAVHDRGLERKLGRRKREGLARERRGNSVHLVEDLSGLDLADEILGIALAVAHANFRRLRRDRLVREYADPDAPAALDVTRHGASRRLDLARREASARQRLESIFAEGDL